LVNSAGQLEESIDVLDFDLIVELEARYSRSDKIYPMPL
jgi:hypothetical protein